MVFVLPLLLLSSGVFARSNSAIHAFNEGVKHFNAREFNDAIPRFDEAISSDPDFVDALYARGACKYYLKSMDGALLDLNDVLRLKSDYLEARALRGALHYESDRWDEAMEDFNYVLEKNPREPQSLLGRAVIELKREEMPAAERDFRSFLRVRPDDPMAPQVRKLLASLGGERTEPEQGSEPEAQAPVRRAARRPVARAEMQKLADGLLDHPMKESYQQKVIRGENAQAVGDIQSAPGVYAPAQPAGSGVDIIEAK